MAWIPSSVYTILSYVCQVMWVHVAKIDNCVAPVTGAVIRYLGTSATSGLRFGAEILRHSLGRSYVTHGLCCWSHCWCVPHTCSSRHLTSHLSHTYTSISTHSLHSHWVHFFLRDSRSVQATSLGFWRQRESHLSCYTSRLGPRLHNWKFEEGLQQLGPSELASRADRHSHTVDQCMWW